MTIRNISTYMVLAFTVSTLTACEVEVPSHANTSRLELVTNTQQDSYAVSDIHDSQLQSIADHHKRYGQTPVVFTVTYDPAVSGAGVAAARDGQRFQSGLKSRGVKGAQYETLPVSGQGVNRQVLVQYDQMTAQPPSDCGRIGGFDSNTPLAPDGARTEADYKLGCSVEALIARQVANPSDLAGKSALGPYDGARAAGQLEDYRKGKEFDELKGETATEQN